jgi:photosystem II stability/assembly factor-like uncharacterized protein
MNRIKKKYHQLRKFRLDIGYKLWGRGNFGRKRRIIFAILFVISTTLITTLFLTGVNSDPRIGFDKPEGYYDYFKQATIPFGREHSGYTPNYAIDEFNKAQKKRSNNLKSASNLSWVQRGPGNVGGRTRTILIDPDDPTGNTWFAGSVSGGIWKTVNGGESWQNLTPELPNLSTASLAMAPSNTNIIYAGTGEGYGGEGMVSGNGIYKSIDKGDSWQLLESIKYDKHFRFVNKLWVSPSRDSVVLAATNTGIYKSYDGGITWDSVYTAGYAVQDIAQNPHNEHVLYAGVNSLGVLKSTDQGNTWHPSYTGMGEVYRVSVSVSPADTSYLFAGIEAPGQQTHIYHSRDAGLNWELNFNADGLFTNFHKTQGWFNNVVAAHPFDRNKVFVGGVNFGLLEFGSASYTGALDILRVDTIGTASFMTFIKFGGSKFSGALSSGIEQDADVEIRDFVRVEIRFGPGIGQKAHRFTVPEGEGAGVPPEYYTFEDFVDVPFEVWDVENDCQLMVSFRDQDRNGAFNLVERVYDDNISGREYLFVHAVEYDSLVSNVDISTTGGYEYKLLYFLWPGLPENSEWNPLNLPPSRILINWGSMQYREAYTTVLADDKLNSELHVDHHDIHFFIHPSEENTFDIIEANDGGIGFSSDEGKTWKQINRGYLTTQFYGIAKRSGAHEYIGGMQDNGTWQSPNGASAISTTEYDFRIEGDGFEALWHPWYPQRILASSYNNFIKISNNFGEDWQWIDNNVLGDGPFITKLSHSRENPNLVFAVGSRGIYRHENFGFGAVPWDLIDLGEQWAVNDVVVSSHHVKVSKADPSVVWAGAGMFTDPDLNISVSIDFGKTFDTTSNYRATDLGYISGLATHPINPAEAFAIFSFKGKPKILRTYNYGQSWQDISGFETSTGDTSLNGFPDVVVNDLLVLPNDTNTIWAATEIGLFESTDNGLSWHIANNGLPSVSVWQLEVVDNEILAATHGRGLWTAELNTVSVHPKNINRQAISIYPNPAKDFLAIEFSENLTTGGTIKLIDLAGKRVHTQKVFEQKVRIDISHLLPGNYIFVGEFGNQRITRKVLKAK